jgi:hypothetical protein
MVGMILGTMVGMILGTMIGTILGCAVVYDVNGVV